MAIANERIRVAAKEAGVCLWEIAEKLNIQDSAFSRKLRRELPDKDRDKVLGIIRELSRTKQKGV